jgi:hypothetical protein
VKREAVPSPEGLGEAGCLMAGDKTCPEAVSVFERMKLWLLGRPRDIQDPSLFRKVSLVAFLAWVGLGADGLSSSAYGPDEAFRALAGHESLAVFLAAATALTVFVISYAYSRMIQQFPVGGGYAVATKLLGRGLGVVAGSALLVDYVLTITVSIAAGADQIFSLILLGFGYDYSPYKLGVELGALAVLVLLNLRGVKESIKVLVPIFLLFVVCHAVLLAGALGGHAANVPEVAAGVSRNLQEGAKDLGIIGLLLILARAYARGAGTYTGIEAVSNAVQIMREPKIETARRTMLYMAVSLAVTAGGIMLAYMLLAVRAPTDPDAPFVTLNAVLLKNLDWGRFGIGFMGVTLVSEAALLLVAAQTGFIGGPRVMANMAMDSWVPHRFSSLSERLTLQDGVLMMGMAGALTLLYTRGSIGALVTMYAINVFITFALTQLGMCRHWWQERRRGKTWRWAMTVHVTGAALCLFILGVVVFEKFTEGAWVTLAVTGALVGVCLLIRRYYRRVKELSDQFSRHMESLPADPAVVPATGEPDPAQPTAALLVSGFGGLGVHVLMTVMRMFPGVYRQVVFVSVGVMDSGNFKGVEEVHRLEAQTQQNLDRYVALARRFGLNATGMMLVGTDPVAECEDLCVAVAKRFPKVTFFAGKLVFQREKWYHRILHNDTAFALQRRLHWQGLPVLILPARVFN